MRLLLGFIVIIGIILGAIAVATAALIGLIVLVGRIMKYFRSRQHERQE